MQHLIKMRPRLSARLPDPDAMMKAVRVIEGLAEGSHSIRLPGMDRPARVEVRVVHRRFGGAAWTEALLWTALGFSLALTVGSLFA